MSENQEQHRSLIDPVDHGRMLAERGEVWPTPLLDATSLARFAHQRGVPLGGGLCEGVERLWQLGWLKADLVRVTSGISNTALTAAIGEGLVQVGATEDGVFSPFADARESMEDRASRVGGIVELEALPEGIEPLFHPFRYHVLHWLNGILQINITSFSTLTVPGYESYSALVEQILQAKRSSFALPSFAEEVREFNERTALAVVTEPLYYSLLFGYRTFRTDLESFERYVKQHKKEVSTLYQAAGLEPVERERKRLCKAAEALDPNTDLQTLIRITRGEERLQLEGTTGGAVLTRTMAELLRRAAEEILETQLPEEDELGLSMLSPQARSGLKQRDYGSSRILDDKDARREFIRRWELDPGPRVRWYVEGETEYGALTEVLGRRGERGVALVNLRAQFGQKKRKTDASGFGESLQQDMNAGIFSYISLDADDKDTVRIVEAAVKNNSFFGNFFKSDPDFELANFTTAELGEILWKKAKENDAPDIERDILLAAVEDVKSNKELFNKAHDALPGYLAQFNKGEEWGRRLIAYAWEHPEMEECKTRPIVEAVELAIQVQSESYQSMRGGHYVDLQSGRLTPNAQA